MQAIPGVVSWRALSIACKQAPTKTWYPIEETPYPLRRSHRAILNSASAPTNHPSIAPPPPPPPEPAGVGLGVGVGVGAGAGVLVPAASVMTVAE